MADEGGVTLRIDANTAAYIAKLAQLAEGHEKVGKHIDQWGSAVEHAVGKLSTMLGPLVLIEEVVRNAEKGFEAWKNHLEAAGKTTATLVDTLRRTTVQTGENREAVQAQLTSVLSPQTVEERVAGFNAFRQNAPTSATRVAPSEIAKKLGLAEIAGYDPTQLAGIAGNVEGARSGAGSFDLAALLLSKTGSNADQASSLIRRLGEKAGPGGAQAALPYLLASSQAGDRRFSFMTEAENAYTPQQGNFDDYMKRRLAAASPNQRGLAGSIGRGLPGARRDIDALGGFLSGRAQNAMGDDAVRERLETKTLVAQAQIEQEQYGRESQEAIERRAAIKALNAANDPVDSAIAPNVHEAFQRMKGKHRDGDYAARGLDDLVQGSGSSGGTLEEIRDAIEEGNADARTKRLRVRAHEDH